MKTTNLILKHCLSATVAFTLIFTSCRKKEMDENSQIEALNTQSEDAQLQTSTVDEAYTEADNSANSSRQIAGSSASSNPINPNWPCDAAIDSSQIQQGIITLTFNGSGCNGKTRTGQMRYTLINYANGIRWKDLGAQLDIDFINYKLIRNGKSIVVNGTHHLTNTSGGLLSDLGPEKTQISRSVTSTNMNVMFDDNTTRSWSMSKNRIWEYNNGNLKLSVTGEANGINRKGKAFTSKTTSPVVCLKSCGWHRPVSGTITHEVESHNAVVTLGTDVNGNPDPNNCPGYFKVDCTGKKGKNHEKIIEYK